MNTRPTDQRTITIVEGEPADLADAFMEVMFRNMTPEDAAEARRQIASGAWDE